MLYLTAVAHKEQHEDDETGNFIAHSPTKTFSKNSCNNMFVLNPSTVLLLTMCLIALSFPQQCLATLAATTVDAKSVDFTKAQAPAPYECPGVSIRRNCEDFEKLKNCTVVTGPVVISLVHRAACNITDLKFENLREITDFLFFNKVDFLYSIKNMFPNLTVIRGRRVFTNYALLISKIDDLEKVEFKSLIALQRGNVLIEGLPKLCFTEKINWARLTSSRGTNNIFLHPDAQCPKTETHCNGCNTESCWSNDVCQKFETDSVILPKQDLRDCHKQCLGGCYNHTAQGCVVCKGYTDNGTCVEECPTDKYASSHYMRCYTREECVNKKNLLIYKNKCVDFCPAGYKPNNVTLECVSCGNCLKICGSDIRDEIKIPDISTAQRLSGCQIFNGSVVIDIYEYFDQRELTEHLKDMKEITGFLKINRSPYLTSLDFFQNLEKVHGYILEHERYSLIIYNNKNLTELWNVKPGFEMVRGGMYIHANNKLCNRLIKQFRTSIKHDNSIDAIQKSDQEVFCSPAKLNLNVKILTHRSIMLFWPKEDTFSEVEIIYRPVSENEQLEEKSEIETDVCDRIIWNRELKFAHELTKNSTYYVYTVQNLEPHTRYAVLVKTFNGDDDEQEARSVIKYATTKFDIPMAPEIFLKGKTSDTLDIEFSHGQVKSEDSRGVDFYILNVYDLPDDKKMLDTRDYCDEPAMDFKDSSHEDYDDCCSRREQERRDKMLLSQLKHDFACSIDHPEYCKSSNVDSRNAATRKMFKRKQIDAWETKYTIRNLLSFHLYVIQMRACNNAGCSSHSMLSARTNYSLAADKIYDFSFCKQNDSNEYRVYFSEPKVPNGYITSYALHFRKHVHNDDKNMSADQNTLVCVTRLEHERKNYYYVAHSNYTFNQAAVRIHSLGHHTIVEWKNITKCSDGTFRGTYLNYFFAVLGISVLGLLLWITTKRYWRTIREWLRDCLPIHHGWRYVRPEENVNEDRHNLVNGVEIVLYPNRPDEMIELQEMNESD